MAEEDQRRSSGFQDAPATPSRLADPGVKLRLGRRGQEASEGCYWLTTTQDWGVAATQ